MHAKCMMEQIEKGSMSTERHTFLTGTGGSLAHGEMEHWGKLGPGGTTSVDSNFLVNEKQTSTSVFFSSFFVVQEGGSRQDWRGSGTVFEATSCRKS